MEGTVLAQATALKIRGGKRLHGDVKVSGSKNISLAVLSAVVLAEEIVTLRNVPDIGDTRIKVKLLEEFGAKVIWTGDSLTIDCSNIKHGNPDGEMVRSIRTSFYMLGPLLARISKVHLPAPGGCNIGSRPVDLHLKGLQALGAHVDLIGGVYEVNCEKLQSAEIYLDFPSAGATQHIMSVAARANGTTVIQNAAMEPEVTALADFLQRLGAIIEGAGTSTITIKGRESLGGCEYWIPADRIQVGTFLLSGAITGGSVKVSGILPEDQTAVVNKLRETGAVVAEERDWVSISVPTRLKATNIRTMPHPGFPTDMQQTMAAILCVAEGRSIVEETIYESRTGHVSELTRMGAQILQQGRLTLIDGVEQLRGAVVHASDLRAGAALCLAGLVASGETVVKNVHFIDRGYEAIEKTLTAIGADVERVPLEAVL